MSDDNDLEKRAIEELLRETSRARARVETMGPSGWMKCPLRSTNKRFLVNTLRSSGLRRRSDGPTPGPSATTGCLRRDSHPGEEHQDRTPPKYSSPRGRAHSSHGDHKRHLIRTHRRCEQEDGNQRAHSHQEWDGRDRRPAKDTDTETQRLQCVHASSSKGHSPPRERSGGSQLGRTRSRSPARGSQSGWSQK